jgi:hypothetical protein
MPVGFIFWLLWALAFISWLGTRWGPERFGNYVYVSELFILALFFFLGWHNFGFIIHQ